ncbi:MAG TPA: hypothetical protein VMM37_10085, partial [Bacteroidota bacterium]|nr:hypothetical protein [Bacteroidota bacterium]
ILTVVGVVLMTLYALLEHAIPQTGYWTVLTVFFIAQVYVFLRIWLKATFYGSQTVLFQGLSAEQHAGLVDATATGT